MKKIVFRKDDLVKIINPVIVERVGYPLTLQKVKDEHFSDEEHQKINEFLRFFRCVNDQIIESKPSKTRKAIIHALAQAKISQLGWGGRERSLYLQTVETLKDQLVYLVNKKVVQTGTHYSGWSSVDYWGEWDGEPGGLSDRKTHVLLGFYPIYGSPVIRSNNDPLVWIEEKNVELVKSYNKII